MKMMNFKEKKMKLLTKEQQNHMRMQKSVTFVKKNLKINILKTQNIVKLLSRNSHDTGKYRGAAHSICNLKYSVTKKIPVGFHNGLNYDYHFIINELAEEF